MKIIAEISAVPLARHRINTTNRGRFLPKRSLAFKDELATIAKAQMNGNPPFTSPLNVSISFTKNTKTTGRLFGDIDNLVKAVLDALNGVVWADDSLIVELHAFKAAGTPKIEINIEEVFL